MYWSLDSRGETKYSLAYGKAVSLEMNATRNIGAEFAYGSGHVNKTKAADRGLVYEATKEDYLNMLCSLNYTEQALATITGGCFTCSQEFNLTVKDLNYPSMAAKVSAYPENGHKRWESGIHVQGTIDHR
ncbi:hypothetical protein Bca4012_062266 [Brassica carinata]